MNDASTPQNILDKGTTILCWSSSKLESEWRHLGRSYVSSSYTYACPPNPVQGSAVNYDIFKHVFVELNN